MILLSTSVLIWSFFTSRLKKCAYHFCNFSLLFFPFKSDFINQLQLCLCFEVKLSSSTFFNKFSSFSCASEHRFDWIFIFHLVACLICLLLVNLSILSVYNITFAWCYIFRLFFLPFWYYFGNYFSACLHKKIHSSKLSRQYSKRGLHSD